MKEVLFNEIFSSTKVENIDLLEDGTPRGNLPKTEQESVKNIIGRNLYLQKALVEELVYVKCMKKFFNWVSLDSQFFIGELCNAEELMADLKVVYDVITPIIDKNQKLVGYSVSDTLPLALISTKELYNENRIDSFILRFLSLTEETHFVKNNQQCLLLEKVMSSQQYDFNMYDDNFCNIIENSLKLIGIFHFFTNKFNEEALEKDCYIQKLIERGHKVYVCKYEYENLLNVYIK